MDLHLGGKTALVTGASTGIGAEIVRHLASEGVSVIMLARRAELMTGIADGIEAAGHERPRIIAADLTDRDDTARVACEAQPDGKAVDILVNAAGASLPIDIFSADDAWDQSIELNFTAVRRLTQAVLPGMLAQRWGRIISFSGSTEPRVIHAAIAAKAAGIGSDRLAAVSPRGRPGFPHPAALLSMEAAGLRRAPGNDSGTAGEISRTPD